jgi:catalase
LLLQHRPTSGANSGHWTTNYGAPIWNNNNALTVGQRGQHLNSVALPDFSPCSS